MSVKERWIFTRPLQQKTAKILEIVSSVLQVYPGILVVYLFGSRVNHEDETSDVDIAFYTGQRFSWDDYYRLYGDITGKLRSNRVDLLWLNEADPNMTFQVIKSGKVVYYSDPEVLNDFELKAKQLFYDYGHYLRKHRHGL